MRTLTDLADLIQQANHAYYNTGKAIMTDAEYDSLVEELRAGDPNHPLVQKVGAPPLGQTFPHASPVGSQEKLKTREEFDRWVAKIPAAEDGKKRFVLQWKLDGLTVVLNYKNGQLTRALTRGDGLRGEDVTKNVLMMQNVKKTLPVPFTGSVRGEAMLGVSVFNDVFKPLGFSNPRNTAAGKMRDQKAPKDLMKHFKVTYFDYVPEGDSDIELPPYETENLDIIKDMFKLDHVETWEFDSPDEVWDKYNKLKEIRPTLDYEVDGVIVRANSIETQKDLGSSADMRPKGQRCIKFEAVSGFTTLVDVELSIGHTGAIYPTGKLKPLALGGVTITSVLLNNFEEIERLGVAIGDEVEVIRAGDVIPKIISVTKKGTNRKLIETPTECISCGGPLIKDGTHIFCRNEDCEGMEFRRLKTWVNKREIKFLGDELLMELYENHGVKSPEQIYLITEEYLSKVTRGNGVVGSAAKQIIAEIDKSRTATLKQFIGSLAIKMIGRRQVEIMMETCGISTLDEFLALTVDQLEALPGFSKGGSKATAIVEGLQAAKPLIAELLKHVQIVEKQEEAGPSQSSGVGKLSGLSFCLTGAMSRKRIEIEADIKAAGGIAMDDVHKGLTYLVQADPTSQSSKSKKAGKYGVKIISEEQLMELM